MTGLAPRILAILLSTLPLLAAGGEPRLIESARTGDVEGVIGLLDGQKATDVNLASADGTTALHWAAHRGDIELARRLLQAGAKPDPANDYGITPLWLACTNRDDALALALLEAGADPGAALWTGETVLMNCARTGAANSVAALLERGADPNASESKLNQTALMWAAAGGHAGAVTALLRHGGDVAAASRGGFTPLLFAARSGDVETGRALVEAGADPDESTAAHGNTLVVASAGGHEDLALYLLEAGANPHAADENGITALHHAARNGLTALNGVRYDPVYRVRPPNMPALARALLESGADPNAQIAKSRRLGPDGSPFEMEGATPMMLAAVSGDAGFMRLLEDYEADPSLTAAGGITPLMAAARAACTGSCAFQGGGNLKASDEEVQLSLEAVRTAVEMGVDVNARNDNGQTAMHMAAFTGADAVVQYLADHGAEVNVRDNYGETPWTMASGISPVPRYRGLYGSHESTAALLVSLGAKISGLEDMDDQAPSPPGQ